MEKTYWALVRGIPPETPPLLRTKLAPGTPGDQPLRVVQAGFKQEEEDDEEEEEEIGLEEGWKGSEDRRTGTGKERLAVTRWRLLARNPEGWAWLLLEPITGSTLPPRFMRLFSHFFPYLHLFIPRAAHVLSGLSQAPEGGAWPLLQPIKGSTLPPNFKQEFQIVLPITSPYSA